MRRMLTFYILLGLLSITASQTLTGISLHKPVRMSSWSYGLPDVAVDGRYNCSYIYICTEEEANPWLTIDLQGLYIVRKIEADLANYEKNESRVLEILIGNDSFAISKHMTVRCGLGYNISCQPPVLGSHVTIRSNIGQDTSALCVCEVLVTGTRDSNRCLVGKWGMDCQRDCPVNCKDSRCTQEDGSCQCKEGYLGHLCQTRCSEGSYGQDCDSTCSEGCFDTCDPISGACACKPGWFSSNCQERCSECYGGVCDKASGACTGDHGGGMVSTPGRSGGDRTSTPGDPGLPFGTSILSGFVIAGAIISITIVALYCINRKRAGHVQEEVESTDAEDQTEVRRRTGGKQTVETSFDHGEAEARSKNGDNHSYVNYPATPYETLDTAQVQDTSTNTYQELRDKR